MTPPFLAEQHTTPPAALPAVPAALPAVRSHDDQTVTDRSASHQWLPLRDQDRERLALLGISSETFEFFRGRFMLEPFTFAVSRKPEHFYLVRGRPISNSELIRHLEGSCWIFTGCRWSRSLKRFRTDHFLLDLDHGPDLWDRYDRTVGVLGKPAMLSRSSASGGLHLWYFLEASVDLHLLRDPDGDRGVLVDLLRSAGLLEAPGSLEIYPRGSYKVRGVRNRIRLPFGRDSRLLDPDDPSVPLTTGPLADLLLVRDRFASGEIDTLTMDALRAPRPASPAPQARPASRGSRVRPTFNVEVAALESDGLKRSGQFNGSVAALAWDYAARGSSRERARRALHVWLDTHNNGVSNTYNANPAAAHAELDEIVDRIFARYKPSVSNVPRPGLSAFESARIVAATMTEHSLADPDTGQIYPRFKVQQFIFDLTRAAKQWLLVECRKTVATVEAKHPDVVPGSAEFDALLMTVLHRFWPDPEVPFFVVQVPYNLVRTIPGVSEETSWPLWRIARATGLFVPIRKPSAWGHRAASFGVLLDFGTWEHSDAEIDSLALVILRTLPVESVRSLYNRHYRERIFKEAAIALAAGRGSAVEEALRGYLRVEFGKGCAECDKGKRGARNRRRYGRIRSRPRATAEDSSVPISRFPDAMSTQQDPLDAIHIR